METDHTTSSSVNTRRTRKLSQYITNTTTDWLWRQHW